MNRICGQGPDGLRGALGGVSAAILATVAACDSGPPIESPQPLESSPVAYPVEQWEQGVEGTTVVRVLVAETGAVDSVVVAEGSGSDALDSAAVHGARSMAFAPAMRGGEPLAVWTTLPIHFSKSGETSPDSSLQMPGEPRP